MQTNSTKKRMGAPAKVLKKGQSALAQWRKERDYAKRKGATRKTKARMSKIRAALKDLK